MNQPTQSTDKVIDDILTNLHAAGYHSEHGEDFYALRNISFAKAAITHQLRLAELRGRIDELNKSLEVIGHLEPQTGASWYRGYVSARMKLRNDLKKRLKALEAELHDLEEEANGKP